MKALKFTSCTPSLKDQRREALNVCRVRPGRVIRDQIASSPASDAARARLLTLSREPFLKACWEPVLFFHYRIAPEILSRIIPSPFALELHEGMARLSLAVVPMSGLRSGRLCSRGLLVQALRQQRFLNLRTYVKCGDERGVLFLHGWLSRPWGLPLPSRMLGLPYGFATFATREEKGSMGGSITGGADQGSLDFQVQVAAEARASLCQAGSAAEFAMEQYNGFFARRSQGYVFRVWHPPWRQVSVAAEFRDTSLITNLFPWFAQATFETAHLTETIDEVWLSRAYRLRPTPAGQGNHHVLSAFYEMP